MKKIHLTLICVLLAVACNVYAKNPKREFRGAWMTTVYQEQYAEQTTDQNKAYIRDQLDKMRAAGVNAVLFQARPSADAFYYSKYEPWSRYLTTDQRAPDPYWDPLEFITSEAHQRGMELHVWINPYRVTTTKNQTLPKDHLYHKEPDRFVRYEGDGRIYFDPGVPQNRAYIVDVIYDIIDRYNIDAIHFDDYFYPYPANGKDFNDSRSYSLYGNGMNRADWRRRNVDKLIEAIHYMIKNSPKPWVRFGISPFGIWRNQSSDKRGSSTNGLQNYDDLYADVLLWAEKGWIDYLVPQLYWELDHKRASSSILIDWWSRTIDPKCHLYIGQDVERTMKAPDLAPSKEKDQLNHKIRLTRTTENVLGSCWFPCYYLTADFMGISSKLRSGAHSSLALVPAYTSISDKQPEKVTKLKYSEGILSWSCKKASGVTTDAVRFVVYRFDNGSEIDIDDADAIVTVTPERCFKTDRPGIYVVTALDRVNNESVPSDQLIVR